MRSIKTQLITEFTSTCTDTAAFDVRIDVRQSEKSSEADDAVAAANFRLSLFISSTQPIASDDAGEAIAIRLALRLRCSRPNGKQPQRGASGRSGTYACAANGAPQCVNAECCDEERRASDRDAALLQLSERASTL